VTLIRKIRYNWKCDDCVSGINNSAKKGGISDSETPNVLDAITALREEINKRLDYTNSKLDKLQTDVNSVVIEMSNMREQIRENSLKCETNRDAIKSLTDENEKLKNEVTRLKMDMLELQQHTRKNNLVITGIPLTPKENMFSILNKVSTLLNIRYEICDISAAHRLPGKRGDNRPPAIVVAFVSRAMKSEWITARKLRKTLTAKEINSAWPDLQVYLNEHLTPHTRRIFNEARELVKSGKLVAAWTSDCRVLIKRNGAGNPYRITQLQQLEDFRMDYVGGDPATTRQPNLDSEKRELSSGPDRLATN
jgi:hypothetical protein